MKLRLPHRLQTAILAAFASVTFFTVGTATLGAAQGEEAPEFASFTDTGFEVSEEELEVDLGEEEKSAEPDSAPINVAGFNGIRESSDEADRALPQAAAGGTDTAPAADAAPALSVSTPADASTGLGSGDLGFTTNTYAGTASSQTDSEPVFQMTAAPAAEPVQEAVAETQESAATPTASTGSAISPLGAASDGLGIYDPYYYYYAPVSAASPMFGAAGDTPKYATWDFEGDMTAGTTTGSSLTPTWSGGGNASYVDTNQYIGWECGNGTSVVTVNLGKAVDIDGSHWIQVASGNTFINGGEIPLDMNHSFTVSAWVKLDAVTGERFIMGTGAYGGKGFSMALNGGKLDFLDKDVAHHNFNNTPTLVPEEWYNFTITYDQANGKTYGYVNGTQIGELSTSGWKVASTSQGLAIGSGSTSQKQSAFDGQIAYMDIVGEYLTEEQIRARYDATPLSAVGTYTWNGAEGENWEDAAWLLNDADNQAFVAGSNAVFGSAGTHTVSVNETTGAHHANVTDTYEFQLTDGITFSAYKLDVAQGASATFTGNTAQVVVNTLTGAGDVNVDGGTMNILGGASMTGSIGAAGGTVNVLGRSTFGSVNMTDGTMNIIGGTVVTGTVNATAGTINVLGEATFASLDMNREGAATAEVAVKEGGVLTLGAFDKSASAKLTLEKGGAADMLGKVYAVGLEGGGEVLGTGACSFESAGYTLKNVAVSARDMVTIGNKLEHSTITVNNYVTLTNDKNTLTSTTVDGAWLIVDEAMQLGNVTVNGGELRLTSASPVTIGSGTIGSAGKLTLTEAGQFTVSEGVFGFDSGATLDLSALNIAGSTPITLGTASNSGSFSAHNLGNVNLYFGPETTYDNASLTVEGGALKLTFAESQEVLYWKGGPGTWDHEEANWHPSEATTTLTTFKDNANIVFGVTGESQVIITEQTLQTGDVTIEQNVDLSLSSNGTLLTAGKVDVKGNLTVSNVAVTAQSLNIEGGSSVTANVEGAREGALATNVGGTGDVVKTGTGSLMLTGDNSEFSGKVTIEDGTLVASGTAGTALGDAPNVVLNGGRLQGTIAPDGDINIAAKADADVSAAITVATGKALTFNTDASKTLTASGAISGAGDIFKDGTGTLVLDAANSFTGNLDINAGTVLVSNAGAVANSQNVTVGTGTNLIFEKGSDVYTAQKLTLERGSTLTFSGGATAAAPLLNIGTLSLKANSSLDFSNIQINDYGSYVLAHVNSLDPAEAGIWKPDQTGGLDLVQFVSMTGMKTAKGFSLSSEDLVSLHFDKNTKLLTLNVAQANTGYYWIPDRGEDSVWDTSTANWKLNNEGNPTAYVNQQGGLSVPANSAYFLDAGEDGVENVELDIADIYVRDLIVAGGNYTFTFDYPQGYFTQDANRLSNFVVRSGATATFENAAVFGGENTVTHICKDATAIVRGVYTWDTYSLNNEGTYIVEFDEETAFAAGLMGHVDNTGYMSLSIKASEAGGWFMVGEVMNREGATMQIAIPELFPDISYGNGAVHNAGDLIYGLNDTGVTGTMHSPLPIDGTGRFKTEGNDLTILQDGTVEQSSMELGAKVTEFNALVTISDSTTVKTGATAHLTAGGTLGDVTLENGATLRLAGDGSTPEAYVGRAVVAGTGSVLDVEVDASLDLDSYNAGQAPTGSIVVGNLEAGDTGLTPAVLRIDGETNVDSLTVMNGTAHLHGGGSVTSLTQSDGSLRFCSDGYVGGGEVSGGTLEIRNAHELTLGSAINVTGGSYTVARTDGTINADALTLVKNMDNTVFQEAVSSAETKWQSGFLHGGQQYVQVFNLLNGATLTSNNVTVTHKDAAGPMTLDNQGRGYLDTGSTVYASYYVRDNYVSGLPGTRGSETRVADYVKLSDVMEASNGQLETVVFDTTEYNDDETVTGSLTVDVQGQHADLFDVKTGAVGVVNIGEDSSGERVMLCCCEEFGSVDGTMLIAGTGIYQLENRGTLGGGVSLLDTTKEGIGPWTGTVRITGSGEALEMAPLAVGSGADASEIEFNHWTGSFQYNEGQTVVSDARILLTGTGIGDSTSAITLTEGNANLKWTNTVNGANARIDHRAPGDFKLVMTGDTSGWNGTFYQGAANSTVDLQFLQDPGSEGTQNAEMLASNGAMNVTYGGDVKTVNGNATVYSQGDMKLTYTGTGMTVNGDITQFRQQGSLSLTVGDGTDAASATFSGRFSDTQKATMTVEKDSSATIATDAPLLRVVGENGSTVTVNSGKTLSLASTDPAASYSQFYDIDNQGTIQMMASGGDIKLIDTTGKTYELGDLRVVGTPGTAAIETSGVEGETTVVNITALSGTTDVLKLTNDNAAGTVNYNLGGPGSSAQFSGKIAYGVDGGNGAAANLVLKGENTAANAVLETSFANGDAATANIVVDAAAAKVLGLSSDTNSDAYKTMQVSGAAGSGNKAIEITGNEEYTYAGKLGENLDVTYSGSGKQTITGGVNSFNGKVTVDNNSAEGGVLELLNASSVNISDLTIGANDTLDLNDGTNKGTAAVSGTMKAGGTSAAPSKLDGNLTMNSGSTYDVSASGGIGGLNLTGALTIQTGAQLSADDLAGVLDLGWFGMYDLAFGVTDMSSFGTEVDWSKGVDATTVFGTEALGGRTEEFYIRYSQTEMGGNGNNVGAVYIYRIPEPATGTLSLLALCALAGRRRRK